MRQEIIIVTPYSTDNYLSEIESWLPDIALAADKSRNETWLAKAVVDSQLELGYFLDRFQAELFINLSNSLRTVKLPYPIKTSLVKGGKAYNQEVSGVRVDTAAGYLMIAPEMEGLIKVTLDGGFRALEPSGTANVQKKQAIVERLIEKFEAYTRGEEK